MAFLFDTMELINYEYLVLYKQLKKSFNFPADIINDFLESNRARCV